MSYLDTGYDEFLNRVSDPIESDVDMKYDSIPGSLISGGVTESADGKVSFNWETGEIVISDGSRNRVSIGRIVGEENAYGIKVVDANGNTVISSTGKLPADQIFTGILTAAVDIGTAGSGTGFVRIDGPNQRIIINDGVTDRVLIGYQENGF